MGLAGWRMALRKDSRQIEGGNVFKPSKEEVERHNATHTPFRSWRAHCVRGKGECVARARSQSRRRPKRGYERIWDGLHVDGREERKEGSTHGVSSSSPGSSRFQSNGNVCGFHHKQGKLKCAAKHVCMNLEWLGHRRLQSRRPREFN